MRSGDFDTVLGGAEIFFGEEAEGLKTRGPEDTGGVIVLIWRRE